MAADACASALALVSMTSLSSPLERALQVRHRRLDAGAIGRRAPSRRDPSAPSRSRAPARRPCCATRPARGTCGLPRRAPRRPCTMRLISSSVRPLEALMTIFCSLPVALSFADTFRMPLASMSKVTSICGMPRGAGGMPSRLNWPSDLLSRRALTLALQHVDRHGALVVVRGREHLIRLGRESWCSSRSAWSSRRRASRCRATAA